MIYPLDLRTVGLIAGALLLVAHLFAVFQQGGCEKWLKKFPRSRPLGTVLVVIAGVWSFLLIAGMDLGEFSGLRRPMMIAIAAATFLSWKYMDEFLAVRSLGMLALLAAEPILGAAFLRPETSRLLVVVLAYAWIILGLFWVGMPWVLRDQIAWLTARRERFQAAAWGGAVYGAAILLVAVIFWH